MTLDTAKASLKWLHNNLLVKRQYNWISEEKNYCEVNFFGGEPMLMFDTIIKPLVLYSKDIYHDDIQFGMTTNVTLLNEKRIKFLRENNIYLLLSIDGDKETQDYNRPCANKDISSFDLLYPNLSILLQYYPSITFRSTVYHETVDKLFENYLYVESLGFKQYFFVPDQRHNWSEEEKEIFKEEVNKIYKYRLNQILNNYPIMGCSNIDNFICQTIKSLYYTNKQQQIYEQCSLDRCGLGTNSGGIGYDGTIWGCQEQATHLNENNLFYIGNIFKGGIDQTKHLKLLNKYAFSKTPKDNKEQCKNCKIKNICIPAISCPSANNELFNDPGYKSDIECFYHQVYYNNSLIFLNILSQTNNQHIQNYLNKYYQNTARMVK